MVAAIAKSLNFSFYEGAAPRQQLLDYLRHKHLLIVLDNFEHLLSTSEATDLVVDLLQAALSLKILVTSRIKLKVQSEQVFPLSGIDFPKEASVKTETAQSSAVRLFVQNACRVRPDFKLTAENRQAVVEICRVVQGMPLGILLAAAWVELLTPAEIAAEIEQSFDFLESDARDVPERQQSLRAVFDHSWRLLTEQEQAKFAQLSVFRGGFTRQAAQAVT